MNIDVYENYPESERRLGYGYRGDCTVVTLSTLTGWTYKEADEYISEYSSNKHGRPNWCEWEETIHSLGFTEKLPYTRNYKITVNQFLKKHPQGEYVIGTRGHTFLIKDGKVLDHSWKPRRRIFMAIQVK